MKSISSPFVGLVPYDKDSRPYFCGRDREIRLVVANARVSRLTVVYGPSGCGKSSILSAGVIPDLENLASVHNSAPGIVLIRDEWSANPWAHLCGAVAKMPNPKGLKFPEDWFHLESQDTEEEQEEESVTKPESPSKQPFPLIILLDQFEDLFIRNPILSQLTTSELLDRIRAMRRRDDRYDDDPPGLKIAVCLMALLNDPQSPVNVVFSLREDCLANLDVFKGLIPKLFDTLLKIEQLDRTGVSRVITESLRRWSAEHRAEFSPSPGFIDSITGDDALKVRQMLKTSAPALYETPFLQLSLERVWLRDVLGDDRNANLPKKGAVLKKETYHELGGFQGIRAAFVDDSLAENLHDHHEKSIFLQLTRYLVSRTRKIPYTASDLVEEITNNPGQLASGIPSISTISDLLRRFISTRLIKEIPFVKPDDPKDKLPEDKLPEDGLFEVAHDTLAGDLYRWREREDAVLKKYEEIREAEEKSILIKNAQDQATKRAKHISTIVIGSAVLITLAAAASTFWFIRDAENVTVAAKTTTETAEKKKKEAEIATDELTARLNRSKKSAQIFYSEIEPEISTAGENPGTKKGNEAIERYATNLSLANKLYDVMEPVLTDEEKNHYGQSLNIRSGDEDYEHLKKFADGALNSTTKELDSLLKSIEDQSPSTLDPATPGHQSKALEIRALVDELKEKLDQAEVQKNLLQDLTSADVLSEWKTKLAVARQGADAASNDLEKYTLALAQGIQPSIDTSPASKQFDPSHAAWTTDPSFPATHISFFSDGTNQPDIFLINRNGIFFRNSGGVLKSVNISDDINESKIIAFDTSEAAKMVAFSIEKIVYWADIGSDSTVNSLKSYTLHVGEIRSVCFSPDGRYIASAGKDGSVRSFETGFGGTTPGKTRYISTWAKTSYNQVVFSHSNHSSSGSASGGEPRLLYTADSGQIKAADLFKRGTSIPSWEWNINKLNAASPRSGILSASRPEFSENDAYASCAGSTGRYGIWLGSRPSGKPNELQPLLIISPRERNGVGVSRVTYRPKELVFPLHIASSWNDGTIMLHKQTSEDEGGYETLGTLPTLHQGRATSVEWSPDGTLLATCGDDGVARIWKFNGTSLPGTPHATLFTKSPLESLLWSNDGKYLITRGPEKSHLWDATKFSP